MNDITTRNEALLKSLEDSDAIYGNEELLMVSEAAQNIVGVVSDTINNVAAVYKDVAILSAQVEVETKRLDHALDCLMVKVENNRQIYRDTLPLLEKNFSSMQDRMDRLMDRALDMLCEDVSDESLRRQEAVMGLIEMTNNSINSLVAKLMPQY